MGIVLDNISYQYDQWNPGGRYALKNVNLAIGPGEYAAVIGCTGSGKSTLLQHLNGLLVPTAGRCLLDGQDVHGKGYPIGKLRQKAALCFQYPEHQLFEETVLKDIAFGPRNLGLDKEEARDRAREAMALTGLSPELEDLSPFSLSGGQKRRAALAGVLAMKPQYLILDEPSAGLDQRGKEMLFGLLRRLNEEKGITVVFTSHDMDETASHARRVILMHEGQVLADGQTEEVFSNTDKILQAGLELPKALQFYLRLKEKAALKDKTGTLPMTAEELAEEIVRQVDLGG